MIDALKLAASFDGYFRSANDVDVPARVSVPRDEWRALHAAIEQQHAALESMRVALGEIAWSNNSKWQADRAREALGAEVESLRAGRAVPDAIADAVWTDSRHYTYVNSKAVVSRNPGFCFIAAGWRRCGMTKGGLLVLERIGN